MSSALDRIFILLFSVSEQKAIKKNMSNVLELCSSYVDEMVIACGLCIFWLDAPNPNVQFKQLYCMTPIKQPFAIFVMNPDFTHQKTSQECLFTFYKYISIII